MPPFISLCETRTSKDMGVAQAYFVSCVNQVMQVKIVKVANKVMQVNIMKLVRLIIVVIFSNTVVVIRSA